jgi:hypothetical protein
LLPLPLRLATGNGTAACAVGAMAMSAPATSAPAAAAAARRRRLRRVVLTGAGADLRRSCMGPPLTCVRGTSGTRAIARRASVRAGFRVLARARPSLEHGVAVGGRIRPMRSGGRCGRVTPASDGERVAAKPFHRTSGSFYPAMVPV